jgi:hypothetical protein
MIAITGSDCSNPCHCESQCEVPLRLIQLSTTEILKQSSRSKFAMESEYEDCLVALGSQNLVNKNPFQNPKNTPVQKLNLRTLDDQLKPETELVLMQTQFLQTTYVS